MLLRAPPHYPWTRPSYIACLSLPPLFVRILDIEIYDIAIRQALAGHFSLVTSIAMDVEYLLCGDPLIFAQTGAFPNLTFVELR